MRLMTVEDLSAAFFTLDGCLERSEAHGANLFEATDFNALLLTEVCKELALFKAA